MSESALYHLIWSSRPLMQRAEALVEQRLRGTGLTVRTRAVLEIIARDGAASVPELARRLEIQRQYVQVMVNEAIAAGYAEKRDNPRHKSSPLICLTDRGGRLIAEVMSGEARVVAQMSEAMAPEEIETAAAVVDRLLDLLDREIGAGP